MSTNAADTPVPETTAAARFFPPSIRPLSPQALELHLLLKPGNIEASVFYRSTDGQFSRGDRTGQRRGAIRIGSGTAFTLIELVTVLTIVAILAAMVIPRFGNSIAHQRAEAAAQRIAADLELARQNAMQTSASRTFQFNTATNDYVLRDMLDPDHPDPAKDYRVDLTAEPYAAALVAADFGGDSKVIFDMHGVPDSGGQVTISVGKWVKTISVAADTGMVTVN
ncbi:MAG: type II secretion system GspH family protein [Planctomycetes bacterium]|nr:type II secretion system GspH family protein [Planctomycetota bacterium]